MELRFVEQEQSILDGNRTFGDCQVVEWPRCLFYMPADTVLK